MKPSEGVTEERKFNWQVRGIISDTIDIHRNLNKTICEVLTRCRMAALGTCLSGLLSGERNRLAAEK